MEIIFICSLSFIFGLLVGMFVTSRDMTVNGYQPKESNVKKQPPRKE